ncbi:MAG: CBS domain-containing protein [Nitrospirae bacterium]|jgi:CBS domain-containing protein|nr:CBS domain-containing protein [Nitrospirota bacterium]
MKVGEIMTKEVHTIGPGQTLKVCAETMNSKKINGMVVVEGGKVLGVITKADIFKAVLPRYPDIIEDERHMTDMEYIEERAHKLYEMNVTEIMGTPPITVSSDMPIVKAGSTMILRRVKQVPVVDNDKLVGIITLTDIINHLLKKIK